VNGNVIGGSDEAYYDTDRAEMLKFLPVGAQRVLELGCGPGRFGALVKRERGLAEYWGMEYEPDVAARAATVLDRVFVGDANAHIDALPDGHFDVIVANDVLEHLTHPLETLQRRRPKLRPDGVVVASIPNIRYLPALAKVVFGRDFPQDDAGIFDRTHLRFFTHKSMRRMFVQAGYDVADDGGPRPSEVRMGGTGRAHARVVLGRAGHAVRLRCQTTGECLG
jgi:SAM-dependent methyltransferase